MPIVAIPFAVVAGVVAATDIAAVGLTIGTALELTAAVGATLGAVGVVTRDKGLQTAGLILGGISGVGMLASAAGLISSTATLFGDTAASAADLGSLPAGAMSAQGFTDTAGFDAAAATGGLPAGAMNPNGFPELTNSLISPSGAVTAENVLPTTALNEATSGAAGEQVPSKNWLTPDASGIINTAGETTTPTATVGATTGVTAETNTMPQTVSTSGNLPGIPPITQPNFNQTLQSLQNPLSVASGDSGIFDKITGLVQNDKSGMIGYGLIKAGGDLIGGLFNPVTPAQVAQMDSQSALNRAAATIQQRQAANAAQPLPIAKRVQTAPVTGLINSRGNTVTGAPL